MREPRIVALAAMLGVAACGSGRIERLADAAETFGSDADTERAGGHWTGIAEPPDVFADGVTFTSGPEGSVAVLARGDAFPVVTDLRRNRREWRERERVDLGLVAETSIGDVTWSVLDDGDRLTIRRTQPPAPRPDGSAVGDATHPQAVVTLEREVEFPAPTSVAATATALVLLDAASGTLGVARMVGGPAWATGPVPAGRVCGAGEIDGRVAFSLTADEDATGCDELWFLDGDAPAFALGGVGSDVAGVGFAEGLALVVRRIDATSCGDLVCELSAELTDADGRLVRAVGSLPMTARGEVLVGEARGVPLVFGGVDRRTPTNPDEPFEVVDGEVFAIEDGIATRVRTDGAIYLDGRWRPMRPFPIAHRRITEPVRIVLTGSLLAVATRNAVGLWAPSGDGASWAPYELAKWPLWVATDSACLNLRSSPSLAGYVVDCIERGEQFWSDGAHATADDESWVSVMLPERNLRGWVAERFLSGYSPDEPASYSCGP